MQLLLDLKNACRSGLNIIKVEETINNLFGNDIEKPISDHTITS